MPHIRAPGRVNLIGDHTDYQDGWCLPVAIDREVLVAFEPRADRLVMVRSRDLGGTVTLPADGSVAIETVDPAWGRTVAATLRVLARLGRAPAGFEAEVASTIPVGSGLSSSAAFGVAMALVATTVAGSPLEGRSLATAAQEIEHVASGVPCGAMDQMAAVCGRAGHAMLLDCRTLAVDSITLPDAVAIVVVHSGLPRRLETSAYAQRRAACEALAAELGVRNLRDARPDQVEDAPLGRHVVSENARVLEFVHAVQEHDVPRAGRIMFASHASLRDDFGVSTPELDRLVDLAGDLGAHGARLTGAGFGGCIVALVPAAHARSFAETITDHYRAATDRVPTAFAVRAVDGAGVCAAPDN